MDTFCYLGYDITNKHSFSDDEEIEKRCQKMRVRASMVASRFKYACADVKKHLFVTYFSSIYCASLWVIPTHTLLHKAKVSYNNCFRIIFNIHGPHSISNELVSRNVNSFEATRRLCSFSLFRRILMHENEIVKTLVCNDTFLRSKIYREWHNILF